MKALIFEVGAMTIFANMVDNITTYLALTASVPGTELYEANPITAWGIQMAGLAPFLVAEFLVTSAVIVWIVRNRRLLNWSKLVGLLVILALTGAAVVNNLLVLAEISVI